MPKGVNNQSLSRLYQRCNELYFNNSLPPNLIISQSNQLRKYAGITYFYNYPNHLPIPFEICLSEYYLEQHPLDLLIVLLHEMIHTKLKHTLHDPTFLTEVDRIRVNYGITVDVVGKACRG